MAPVSPSGALHYSTARNATRYVVMIEPNNKNWLFALDVPAAVPPDAYSLVDLQLRSRRPVDQRLRYEMTSWLDYHYGEDAGPLSLQGAARVRRDAQPAHRRAGPRSGRARDPDPRAILDRADPALQPRVHLHARSAAARSARSLRRLPLPLEAGFCEHYAGSFALLMRAAGHSRARGDRLPGRRGEPVQQRAHRAPGRRPRVDRDLDPRRGLGARRPDGRGFAAARGRRCERGPRAHRHDSLADRGRSASGCSPT